MVIASHVCVLHAWGFFIAERWCADMKRTGAQIVLEVLLRHGVDTVFGYPGGNVLPIYEELRRRKQRIRHVLTVHEQGAAHAADGYARASGRCGVCFATSGPGATNLVTGIATAYMDSSPVVFITGNANAALIGRDAFQEADITGITIPITKNNYMVSCVEEIADTLYEAFYVACSGRPGPVLVDIPHDVLCASCDWTMQEPRRIEEKKIVGDIAWANRLIAESSAPLLLIGGGAKHARDAVWRFAGALNCPVVCTMMGLGILPSEEENLYGMLGAFGTDAANCAVERADLVIAVGTRFSDRILTGAMKEKRILHFDIDRAEIGKNITPVMAIEGDAGATLTALDIPAPKPWGIPKQKKEDSCMRALSDAFSDAIVITEVGEHQILAARNFDFTAENQWITPGGFGTMGFGLGAAIGAAMAQPGRRILHLAGDGSFRMNCMELATVAAHQLPITTIVFDNQKLGMVRTWQNERYQGKAYASSLPQNVDYLALAGALSVHAAELPKDLSALRPGVYRYLWE